MFIAVIPCAGMGKRMGKEIPKQFLSLKGIPLFIYTLKVFEDHPHCKGIHLVVPKDFKNFVTEAITKFALKRVLNIHEGGSTRQESVYNGLKDIIDKEEIILVHDGVRPLVDSKIITEVYKATLKWGAAIPVIPVRDALIEGYEGWMQRPINREGLYLVQTPQGIKFSILKDCLEKALREGLFFPDESSLLFHYGYKVRLVEGSLNNFKITYPEDLVLAEKLISI